jgi:Tol biopolymer transport system component
MIRRSLDADSEYVDAALHLSGMAAIQSRSEAGGLTRQIRSYISNPKSLRLVKSGAAFYMYFAGEDGVFHLAGGSMKLTLNGTFYVGLAACAHDKDATEKVVFSNVEVKPLPPGGGKPVLYSTLEVGGSDRRAVFVGKGKIEAPHWSKDGKTLYFTYDGRIFRMPAAGGVKPQLIDSGDLKRIDSHTGISPDGNTLAVTDHEQIYTFPIEGGEPRLVARESSEFRDWSPDGKSILLTGVREFERRLTTIRATGGPEKTIPVTRHPEDPVWSPDGQYIYFVSDYGQIAIWRVQPDGSHAERVTPDSKFIDTVPQVSPDGKQMAFLSSGNRGEAVVRIMDLQSKAIRIAAVLPSAQGELGIQPWSPDSKFLAFVSYQTAPF